MSSSVHKALLEAPSHIKAGQLAEAKEIYKQTLSKFPKNKKAIQGYQKLTTPNQAAVDRLTDLYKQGRLREVVSTGENLAEQYPNALILYDILGASYIGLKKSDKAIASYQKALQLNPNHTDSYNNMGMALNDQGRFDEAVESYQKAINLEPNYADAHYNLGNALQQTGDLKQAIESYKASLALSPDDAEVLLNYGNALKNYGDFDQAIRVYAQVMKINPTSKAAKMNMDNAADLKADLDKDVADYARIAKLEIGSAEIASFTGTLLKARNFPDAAMDSYKQAIKVKPDYAQAYFNIGNVQAAKNDESAAIESYELAIKNKKDYIEAYTNLGTCLINIGNLEAATKRFSQALEIDPGSPSVTSALIYAMARNEKIGEQELFTQICYFAEKMEANFLSEWPVHKNLRDPDRCLKIGFVSGDFNNHAVALFFKELIDPLSKCKNLQLHAYYNNTLEDSVTKELKKYFLCWNLVENISDEQLVQDIMSDEIDILIDLSNHSAKNRLAVFARKPAPLQVTTMGLHTSTGLTAIDYYLGLDCGNFSDKFLECYVGLPSSVVYRPLLKMPPVNALPVVKNGFITFSSFNKIEKISRACITLWGRLLREIPNSRLLFCGQESKTSQDNFEQWFIEEHIELDRIIFQPKKNFLDYCFLHHQVDINLIAFPISGATTIFNALSMGVPSFCFASSENEAAAANVNYIFSTLGLSGCISYNEDDFILKVTSLTNEIKKLTSTRKSLRQKLSNSVFCNSDVAAAGWEAALRIMWRRWCSDLDPKPFQLKMEDLKFSPSNGQD